MYRWRYSIFSSCLATIVSFGLLAVGSIAEAQEPQAVIDSQVEALKFIPGRGSGWGTTSAPQAQPRSAESGQAESGQVPVAALEAVDLPPNARPGECYARVFVPPSYQTESEQIVVRQASEKVEVIPAQYGTIEETVLVKEESEEIRVIPARYDWVEEKVLVEEASERLITVPAVYGTESEQLMVHPAYTTWKKGRGPIEKIDQATGEIMCLVEVPAEYKTVTKTVVVQPETTRKEVIPAKYKTVKRQVVVEPARVEKIEIPAEYSTVSKQMLVQPASERRIAIPAEYSTVSKQIKVGDGRIEWRPILCETNATADVIADIQKALMNRGHNPGRFDGVLGQETMSAVDSFQRANGLVTGQLTMETVNALDVSLAR